MDLRFTDEDEKFRTEVSDWLADALSGEFAGLRGRGGPGDEHACLEERRAWERKMGQGGWIGISWPKEVGGRDLSLTQQVIFNEEYCRAQAPGRLGHIGETLLAPTIIAFGSDAQKARFLPKIISGEEMWCQGYSEPNAGSDLANVQTRAIRDGDSWSITGQKIWTSGAAWSDWCFALCRTDVDAAKHKGISYLLVPMNQPGVEVRPIEQITGDSEFAEVFFDGARADLNDVVGGENNGWKVAMGTLAFERGASTLGQQMAFRAELEQITQAARDNGAIDDPVMRQRLAKAWMGLNIMRLNALRMLTKLQGNELSPEAMITKIFWATWHRDLGELAMDVLGMSGQLLVEGPFVPTPLQRLFLFSRSDTIYAGSNQIQRDIIARRALGLPRGAK